MKRALSILLATIALQSYGLSPVKVADFYKSIDHSTDIQLGEWSGRGDLCIQKAKETGYLMLWFLTSIKSGATCEKFLKTNLCRNEFCNLINDYKYIILCCEDYGDSAVRNRKDSLYGFVSGGKILDEKTGEYVRNWNGYSVKTEKDGVINYCDPPPSLHLLKFDTSANIIFHVCGTVGKYDTKFSPYASKFPIPDGMNKNEDKFAPWLKQYLDMYPVKEQIEKYENAGGQSQSYVPSTTQETKHGTNYTYEVVEIAVTETIHPTVYQIALHRDNLLFRSVTMMRDILAKGRIEDVFTQFDTGLQARNSVGKWFVNHDDTVSAISSELSDGASLDILPSGNCTLMINQRVGSGFTLTGHDMNVVTNVEPNTPVVTAIGTLEMMTITNITTDVSSNSFIFSSVGRNEYVEIPMLGGKLYRISVDGNSTFDILSTK